MPSPARSQAHTKEVTRVIMPGHCCFRDVTPNWRQATKFAEHNGRTTNILIPDATAAGKTTAEDVRYGRVTQCSAAVERTTCKEFDSKHFPLEAGTYIIVRQHQCHKIAPNEFACNTFDIIYADKSPEWAPEE